MYAKRLNLPNVNPSETKATVTARLSNRLAKSARQDLSDRMPDIRQIRVSDAEAKALLSNTESDLRFAEAARAAALQTVDDLRATADTLDGACTGTNDSELVKAAESARAAADPNASGEDKCGRAVSPRRKRSG